MKRLIFPLLLLLPAFLPVQAKTLKQGNDSLLAELDKAIADSELYAQRKMQRIDELKHMLQTPQITPEQRYDLNARLSREYRPFKLDSAIHYTRQNTAIARAATRDEAYYESVLNLSRLYSITARSVEASELLRSIPAGRLSERLKIQYYDAYKCFYNYYPHHTEVYARHQQTLRDSLMSLYDPSENGYKTLLAEQFIEDGRYREAQTILLALLEAAEAEDGWRAVVAYLAGNAFVPTEDYDLQIRYFALSAIADVKNAIKENMSLNALAQALYHSGDIERAYRYIRKSLEDAMSCNARLRTMEISRIFPIIEQAKQAENERQQRNLRILNCCILLLSVFLVATLVYGYAQMKRLSKAKKTKDQLNRKLKEANRHMHDINRQLQESNTLKEEYIARYMNEASSYLDKLEEYRRELNRMAKDGKVDELYKALKSDKIVEEELHAFYTNFDRSFLQLFPDFIAEFNALLHEDEHITPKPKELLNTELRIFALIRLGISDSNMIAHFLRYPVRTIYNYRTRVRNKAAGKRGELEEEVMKIGMGKAHGR